MDFTRSELYDIFRYKICICLLIFYITLHFITIRPVCNYELKTDEVTGNKVTTSFSVNRLSVYGMVCIQRI